MKEANFICLIMNLCIAVLVGALLPVLPTLTRKSFLFGVKIPSEEQGCPEARNMKKQYITVCLIGAVAILALVIIQYIAIPDITMIAAMYFPLLFVVVQMAAFIQNWKKAVKLKAARGWKIAASVFADTKSSHSRGNLSELPWAWYVLSLIMILASVVIALFKYPGLPDRIPTHFDFNMQPDAWSDKSLLAVMTVPLINLATLLVMWLTGFMLVRAKLQIDLQKPELSFAQHRIYRRRMGHSVGFLTLCITIGLALIGLMGIWPDFRVPFWLMMVLLLVPVVPLVVISVMSGQGGCKITPKTIIEKSTVQPNGPSTRDKPLGRGDDRYWALGMFYHNPDDPAYLVEDRFGSNLGFNYSRLPVKIGVALSVLLFVVGYIWITVLLCAGLLWI